MCRVQGSASEARPKEADSWGSVQAGLGSSGLGAAVFLSFARVLGDAQESPGYHLLRVLWGAGLLTLAGTLDVFLSVRTSLA